MGTAVQGMNEMGNEARPDQAARKRVAVELVRDHDRPLRWTARRYSICAEDAEDAYQRGIEILLSKAPTTDAKQLLPWARTVIKHEALAIRKTRERTLARPGVSSEDEAGNEDWVQLIPAPGDGPDELTVRREKVARSREALALLKPAELKALTQLAEGFSYQEIGDLNSWTRTKVNRCLSEGRARFRSAFQESESGQRCPDFEPLLSACCDDELTGADRADLENHLAVCGHCRSTLRAYRAAPKAVAALAPALPVGRGLWDRLQELAVEVQVRLQGAGRSGDSAIQGVVASGGTRGAGVAALAKLVAVCAGTAGTAAVCAATGVLPAADLLPGRAEKPAQVRTVERVRPAEVRRPVVFSQSEPEPSQPTDPTTGQAAQQEPPERESEQPQIVEAEVPSTPTPTETEFTPEAAGTPVYSAPPPTTTKQSSPVPVGNGGGEFAP